MKNVQINISIPEGWKDELENLARIYSVEEESKLTYLVLMGESQFLTLEL